MSIYKLTTLPCDGIIAMWAASCSLDEFKEWLNRTRELTHADYQLALTKFNEFKAGKQMPGTKEETNADKAQRILNGKQIDFGCEDQY